ncbi:pyridoxamine 5'-phosphate oxidase family protein [Psychroflexus aestuariivivens]|uniref:pyridoxamine 5'-phosphate oxidase family protein n=1 Tax=Psychroflexus aestuariivivens TaxID=1795040 RepID=UPI000FDC964B|nr:pyridoxamine 5'-phosphate oxidase family protein [Psychroflexus aestuariivivens]
MLDKIRKKAEEELQSGVSEKNHAYRFATLASIRNNQPKCRTIVLRAVENNFNIIFYTDSRSDKVEDFQNNPNASALFYNHDSLLHLEVRGKAKVITDPNLINAHWEQVKDHSTKDYTTEKAPGTRIKHPDEVEYSENNTNFSVVELVANEVEVLQLKRPNHIRSRFYKNENSKWIGKFLNP